jgi:repressor LexA
MPPVETAFRTLHLLGSIKAGLPLYCEENIIGTIEVPTSWLKGARGRDYFALRVQGDSMIEAGIHEGDVAILRRQETAHEGEIVAALADGDSTLKYVHSLPDGIELRPANKNMQPIKLEWGRGGIQGVVVGLIRNYVTIDPIVE